MYTHCQQQPNLKRKFYQSRRDRVIETVDFFILLRRCPISEYYVPVFVVYKSVIILKGHSILVKPLLTSFLIFAYTRLVNSMFT